MPTSRFSLAGLTLVVAFGLLMATPPRAAAENATPAAKPAGTPCPVCGRTKQQDIPYAEKAGSTLIRGATNTLFGWTEMIRQPANAAKAGGDPLTGIAQGAGHSFGRTFAGLGEILTFWTPKVNDEYVYFANDCPLCMKSPEKSAPAVSP